jgi:hypothetical protein
MKLDSIRRTLTIDLRGYNEAFDFHYTVKVLNATSGASVNFPLDIKFLKEKVELPKEESKPIQI